MKDPKHLIVGDYQSSNSHVKSQRHITKNGNEASAGIREDIIHSKKRDSSLKNYIPASQQRSVSPAIYGAAKGDLTKGGITPRILP